MNKVQKMLKSIEQSKAARIPPLELNGKSVARFDDDGNLRLVASRLNETEILSLLDYLQDATKDNGK